MERFSKTEHKNLSLIHISAAASASGAVDSTSFSKGIMPVITVVKSTYSTMMIKTDPDVYKRQLLRYSLILSFIPYQSIVHIYDTIIIPKKQQDFTYISTIFTLYFTCVCITASLLHFRFKYKRSKIAKNQRR